MLGMFMAESKWRGIISLILGIASILFFWVILFSIPASVLGIIFSIMQKKTSPNKIAAAGLVTSIIGLCLTVLLGLIYLILPWLASKVVV